MEKAGQREIETGTDGDIVRQRDKEGEREESDREND